MDAGCLPLSASTASVLSCRCCWLVRLPCAGGLMHAAASTKRTCINSPRDQHEKRETIMTYLSSPRADAFRLAPRSSLCSRPNVGAGQARITGSGWATCPYCYPSLQQTKTAELEARAGLHGTPVDAERQIPDETDMQAGPHIEPTTTGSNSPSELPGASSDRLQPAGALIVKAFRRQNAQQQTRVHPPLADTWTAA